METITITPDLSLIHKPITEIFEIPTNSFEWDKYRLSREQIEFYKTNGYLSGIKILNDDQISILKNELTELFDINHPGNNLFHEFHSNQSADPSKVIFHALGHWRITPGFHDLWWNPYYVMAASQLLGGPIRLWHDQLFCKPAHHGGVVAWHQDYSYWTRTRPMQHLTCWCGLDNADISNGCLYYVPGSHNWDLLDMPDLTGDMNGIFRFLNKEQTKQFNPIPIELKAGFASFHHPLLVHGSYENKTDRQRRAFVLNCFKDGVVSDESKELLKGVPIIPKGKPMEGQFFPKLSPDYFNV
ncbi:MAG: phytanoyl-CoA dioxygenase family protein [Bacteroidota bacterium]|nr:phytanoyl-CoA dioxygenase family protein [Bacteroidota bacterium]